MSTPAAASSKGHVNVDAMTAGGPRSTSFSCGALVVAAIACLVAADAFAAITITNPANITLAASQVESGGDTTSNPYVTGGSAGALILYTETGSFTCCGASYLGDNLDDGDGATNSDGLYAIADSGALVLDFGGAVTIGSIAVYNGYTNRDDGSYVLRDAASNVLGSWTITTPDGTNSNDGADSFWLTFDAPVTTTSLTLDLTSSDAQSTVSFREIEVRRVPLAPVRADLLAVGDQRIIRDGTGLDWLDLDEVLDTAYDAAVGLANANFPGAWRHATTAEMCILLQQMTGGPYPCPGSGSGNQLPLFDPLAGDECQNVPLSFSCGSWPEGAHCDSAADCINDAGAGVCVATGSIQYPPFAFPITFDPFGTCVVGLRPVAFRSVGLFDDGDDTDGVGVVSWFPFGDPPLFPPISEVSPNGSFPPGSGGAPVTASVFWPGGHYLVRSSPQGECDDFLDNDGDGLVDLADPSCTSPADPSESTPVPVPVPVAGVLGLVALAALLGGAGALRLRR